MENNLTERYIYAVTRRLPAKMKEDIAKEIRTLIEDMLEERCGIISPTEKDVRVVLTELGTPDELYQTYSGSGEKCLIGPPYYAQYLFVLKLVLLCTAFGLTVSLIVQLLTPNGAGPWYEILLQWFFTVFSGLGMGFAYVTLLFAFFYHKKIEFDTAFSLDDLPQVPEKKELIPRGEPIASIVFIILFLCIFLWASQIFCVLLTGSKERIPVFDVNALHRTWYLIVLFAGFGLIREIAKLMEGRYTKRLLLLTAAMDLGSGITAVFWLRSGEIINPRFAEAIRMIFDGEKEIISIIFENFHYCFLGVILFALLLDILTILIRTLKNS